MENLFNDIEISGNEERWQNIYTGEWTTTRPEYGTVVGEYINNEKSITKEKSIEKQLEDILLEFDI